MKKTLVFSMLLLLVAGCSTSNPNAPTATPSPKQSFSPATELPGTQWQETVLPETLLPPQAGYEWTYFGTAEYGLSLRLRGVSRKAGETVYSLTGEVADMSGGESKKDHSVRVTYVATADTLSVYSQGEMLMDNVFSRLVLVKTPLAIGTRWTQNAETADGKNMTLDCTITGIQSEGTGSVYEVDYKQRDGPYFEKRKFSQGKGLVLFERQYGTEAGSTMIGYYLNERTEGPSAQNYEAWLPELGKTNTFFGLAEYGHKGKLTLREDNTLEAVYDYNGQYSDGRGTEEKFQMEYRVDKTRRTVTERVLSNQRGKPEVNSKLHNLVILKFPLHKGMQWSQTARLNGKEVTVRATVTVLDPTKGLLKVSYAATPAEGYYNNTYLEERTFETGLGMTAFSNLLPGDIGLKKEDLTDRQKVANAIIQHSFGYSMNKSLGY